MEQPNYYAIIPANVRYDNSLSDKAKLLYGEIVALSNKDNNCWASNQYFSELYNVTNETISRLISILIKKGYLERQIIYKNNSKEIEKRVLIPIDKNINTYYQKYQEGIDKNVKDNNTSINNIINNNKLLFMEKNKKFIKPTLEELKEYALDKNLYLVNIEEFYDYYESNGWKVGKNSMKDWKSTLRNWQRNEDKKKPKYNDGVFKVDRSRIIK